MRTVSIGLWEIRYLVRKRESGEGKRKKGRKREKKVAWKGKVSGRRGKGGRGQKMRNGM